MQKAFTMVELVFVIVVIGILATVAVPKLAPLADTAKIGKAKATIATIRSAIYTEYQKQTLDGIFTDVNITNDPGRVFSRFTSTGNAVLENDLKYCLNTGCWAYIPRWKVYVYSITDTKRCAFELKNNRFELKAVMAPHCKPFLPE